MRNIFTKIDKNGDGQLTIDELETGLKDVPEIKLDFGELAKAIEMMDANQNGKVDYTEFIAACMNGYNYLREKHLQSAFLYFDKDNNGSITRDEFR